MKVKVLQPFMFGGEPQEPGDTLEIDAQVARTAVVKGWAAPVGQARSEPPPEPKDTARDPTLAKPRTKRRGKGVSAS